MPPSTRSSETSPTTPKRRMRGAYACVEGEGERERGQRCADGGVARARDPRDLVDPPRRADRLDPLEERESGRPGGDPAPPHVDRACRSQQEVGGEDAEERHEERAEQEQERLVGQDVDDARAERGGSGNKYDEEPLRGPGQDVLQRDSGRVDVRERLVVSSTVSARSASALAAPPAAMAVKMALGSARPRESARSTPSP